MKTSSLYIIAIVSSLSVTSICTADALLEDSAISAAESETQASTAQFAATSFFEANWKINGNRQTRVQVDVVTENAANYLDNNWTLPR